MGLKVIITGVTGMVGEGVLIESLRNESVDSVLVVTRKPLGLDHPKLKELVVSDFLELEAKPELRGFDACFYCAGISSNGMSEELYTRITYETTLHFANVVSELNPKIIFNFISGASTDGSEKGKAMWARVKGKTENALRRMFPGRQYSFRPALMKPFPEQRHLYGYNKWIVRLYPVMSLVFPACTIQEIARAMIQTTRHGYKETVLEVQDIKAQAGQS